MVAVVALGIGLDAQATATSKNDAARDETTKATTEYNLGRYDEAIKHYEEAYRLRREPILLFNIGQSHRLAGRPEKALTAYKAYLRTAPPDAHNRDQVSKRIEELERILAETKTAQLAPPPATEPPAPRPLEAPRGALTLESPSLPLNIRTAPQSQPVYSRWWFWAGVGAVAITGTLLALTLSSGGGNHAPMTALGNQDIFR